MPCVAPFTRARILERLVLQPLWRQPHAASICQQAFAVRGNEVSHRPAIPHVPVQPEAARHGVNHPLPPRTKLTERRECCGLGNLVSSWRAHVGECLPNGYHERCGAQLQAISPSLVAGATAVTVP